jgi:hypothetical protein
LYSAPDELEWYNIQKHYYEGALLGLTMVTIEYKLNTDVMPALLSQLKALLSTDQFDFAVIRDVYHLPNYSSYPWEEMAHKNYCSTRSETYNLCADGFPQRQQDGAVGNVALSRSTVQFLVDNEEEFDVTKYDTWEGVIAGLLLQKGNFQFHRFTMNEQSVEQKQKPFVACYLTQGESYTADDLRKTMKGITKKIWKQQNCALQESGTTKGLTKKIKKQQEELVQESGTMEQITKRRSKKIAKKDKKQQQKESPQENRRIVSCAAHLSAPCTIQQSVPSYRCASSACARWLCSHGEAETTPLCESCLEKQFLTPTKICNDGASCSYTCHWHYGDLKLCTQGTTGCKNLACASCTVRSLSLFRCVRNKDIRICTSCSDASLTIPSLSKHLAASKDESKGGGGSVEMTTIKEDDNCLFAGLHNADTQCAVIAMVQAQNAVAPLRDVTLTHQCESPETCQKSFIGLVRRVNTQQPLTSPAPVKRQRGSLARSAKARSLTSVQCDNAAVADLTKSIKVAMYLGAEVWQQLEEKDAKKKKRKVEKEQVDVGELLGKVFSGFCAEGKSQLQRLTAYHSLQINYCLKCKGEWSTKSVSEDAVPLVLNDDWGNEAKTIHEAFNFSAKPIRKRLRCNDANCAGVEASSCTIPYGPAPHVLLLQFNYTKNRKLPFQVPFTYELHATGARYELLSLNCHIGPLALDTNGAHSGHYVNYSKRVSENNEQGAWYRADDNVVQKLKPGENILPGDKPYFAYYVRLPAGADTTSEGGFEQTVWVEPGPNMGSRPAQKQFMPLSVWVCPSLISPFLFMSSICSFLFLPSHRSGLRKGATKNQKR